MFCNIKPTWLQIVILLPQPSKQWDQMVLNGIIKKSILYILQGFWQQIWYHFWHVASTAFYCHKCLFLAWFFTPSFFLYFIILRIKEFLYINSIKSNNVIIIWIYFISFLRLSFYNVWNRWWNEHLLLHPPYAQNTCY